MAVNLSDPEVEFITRQFYSSPPGKEWVILTYSPQRDKLILHHASNTGDGRPDFERWLEGLGAEEVGYGCLREADQGGRVVFVTWVGKGVGGVKRARATVHGRLVGTKLFNPHDLAITVNTLQDLAEQLPSALGGQNQQQAATPVAQVNGTNGTNGGHQHAEIDTRTSAPLPQAEAVSQEQERKARPDLPHLSTLGPVSADEETRSRTSSNEPPLPSPLKELPAPPFAPDTSQQAPPSQQHTNHSGQLSSPASVASPVDRQVSTPVTQPQQTRSPLSPSSQAEREPEPPSSTRPSSSNNPITRLSSLKSTPPPSPTGSNFSGKSTSSSMGRPSIPLFSSLSILGRGKGKGRSVSAGSGPPPVPPKDSPANTSTMATPSAATSPMSYSHFPIGTTSKPIVEDEPPVSIVRGLDKAYGGPVPTPVQSSRLPQVPNHQSQYQQGGLPSSPPRDSTRPPLPAAIIVKSPTVTSIDPEDAYDAYDPGSPHSPPRPSAPPATATSPVSPTPALPLTAASGSSSGSHDTATPPPTATSPVNGQQNGTTPLDLTQQPRYPTYLADHFQKHNQTQIYPTHRSVSTPTAAHQRDPSSPSSATSASPNPPHEHPLTHFRRTSREASSSSSHDPSTSFGWLQDQQSRRISEDREQLAAAAAASTSPKPDAVERRRAKEAEEEERKREKERAGEERLRIARERTAEIEREEERKREEKMRKEEEGRRERERREREEGERKRVVGEQLRLARREGGRLADGWLTVQPPNSVVFRRRYFHILPSSLLLYTTPPSSDTATPSTPLTTIALPSEPTISDAYEEIQVLHSFRLESADGTTFLFYCDSEADKEVVVEALKVAGAPPPA